MGRTILQDTHKERKEGIIELLQRQINTLHEDKLHDEERVNNFVEANENARNEIADLHDRIHQLQDMNSKNDALIQNYKEKSDSLEVELDNLRPMSEINDNLKSENDILKRNNELLKRNFEDANKALSELQEMLKSKDIDFENRLQKEIRQLADMINFEKEREILNLKASHQDKVAQLQENYSIKVNELLQQREKDLQEKDLQKKTKKYTAKKASDSNTQEREN